MTLDKEVLSDYITTVRVHQIAPLTYKYSHTNTSCPNDRYKGVIKSLLRFHFKFQKGSFQKGSCLMNEVLNDSRWHLKHESSQVSPNWWLLREIVWISRSPCCDWSPPSWPDGITMIGHHAELTNLGCCCLNWWLLREIVWISRG